MQIFRLEIDFNEGELVSVSVTHAGRDGRIRVPHYIQVLLGGLGREHGEPYVNGMFYVVPHKERPERLEITNHGFEDQVVPTFDDGDDRAVTAYLQEVYAPLHDLLTTNLTELLEALMLPSSFAD